MMHGTLQIWHSNALLRSNSSAWMFVEKSNSYSYPWGGKGSRDAHHGPPDEPEEDRYHQPQHQEVLQGSQHHNLC